jgi:hypothetical protein
VSSGLGGLSGRPMSEEGRVSRAPSEYHGAQLYERWGRALRGRQSGVDLKPPQAAVVKNDGGERCGNGGTRSRQARLREASASEPSMKCRKRIRRCQNRGLTLPPGSARGNPEGCPSGIRHVDGAKLNQAFVRNVRTCAPMRREKSQAAKTARIRVPMRSPGTEQLVLGMKAL